MQIEEPTGRTARKPAWKEAVEMYSSADDRRSLWQIVNTLVPYIALLAVMYLTLEISYWLTLALAVPTAGFMVRLFIQFHDCGHRSFFSTDRANVFWGKISGVLVFTPFFRWSFDHAVHHASSGDLDRRGTGDVWTMTVDEWNAASPRERLKYRLYRNPAIMFIFGPLNMLLLSNRIIRRRDSSRARRSILGTNLAIVAILVLAWLTIGLKEFFLVQLPVAWLAGMAGVWLFYVQHQFEGVYWEEHEEWDYVAAALAGSSYYRLPKILQWFTGNIGIHHIHHLEMRIPNYRLQECHDDRPQFQIEPVTLKTSLKSIRYRLYDKVNNRLVSFRQARLLQPEQS